MDLGPQLLLLGHPCPDISVEAIALGADGWQLVSQPAQAQPLRVGVSQCGAEPIPLGADLREFRPGRLLPQLLDLGPQPAVLGAEFLQLSPQSLRLLELALDSLQLLLKVVQPGSGLGELVLRLGELPDGGFTLGGQGGADPMEFILPARPMRWVRLSRSRPGGRWTGWGDRARVVARSGAEPLAAMFAVDLATEMGAPDPQVAPVAMRAGDPEMLGRVLAIPRRLDHRSCPGCW